MNKPTMHAVESSAAKAVGADDEGNLYVTFNSGKTYRYDGAAHHLPMLRDPNTSVGKYVNSVVKPQFTSSEVTL